MKTMRKLDLLAAKKNNKENLLHFNHGPSSTSSSGPPPYQPRAFRQFVVTWNAKQVVRWIEGLGDCVRPWLGPIRANIRSGKHLLIVDDDFLTRIGVTSLGPRKVIVQAIQLLQRFCDEICTENLQLLAMRVLTAAQCLSREMVDGQRMRETAVTRAQVVAILNNISSSISNLAEQAKKLIFWLDRSPFDEMTTYIHLRHKIASLVWDLLRMVNVTPRVLFNNVNDIVKRSNELRDQCEFIVRFCEDPLVIYTAYVEKVSMRRHDVNTAWGINLLSSYRGVHVISEVKVGSPADLCGKVDAGDEIMVINGETVIGWDLAKVAERMSGMEKEEEKVMELQLVLKKRPREAPYPMLVREREREAAKPTKQVRPLARIAPGSQLSTMGEEDTIEKETRETRGLPEVEAGYTLKRRRSSTFKTMLKKFIKQDSDGIPSPTPLRRRRASVCGGSPPPRQHSEKGAHTPAHHLQVDLMALVGPNGLQEGPRVIRRARTMRHQPDGYVRSFIDNQLIKQVDDDVTDDQLPFNTKCPTEFASVEVVAPAEVSQLGVPSAKPTDPEWAAPFKETAEYRFRSPMGDSNLSAFSLDSPGIRKMTSSGDDAFGWGSMMSGVIASPSTSSMHSAYSPIPAVTPSSARIMSFSVTTCETAPSPTMDFCSAAAPPTPETPCTLLTGKTFEGWVRRRKMGSELASAHTNKWPKCWMALRGPYLYVYPTQFSKRADMTISVVQCAVTDARDLKTSKKFVFRLHRGQMSYYFSCYSAIDMNSWIHKIIVASEIHSHGTGRVMSKSISCMRSDSDTEPPSSPLLLPMDSPGGDPLSPAHPHNHHHTLPRNTQLCGSGLTTSGSATVSGGSATRHIGTVTSLFAPSPK